MKNIQGLVEWPGFKIIIYFYEFEAGRDAKFF